MLKLKQPDPDEVVEKANDLNALMPANDDTGFHMSDAYQAPYLSEVLPTCRKCQTPMALKRFRAGRQFSYIGKFECPTCHRKAAQPVELRVTSSPPLVSAFPPAEEA